MWTLKQICVAQDEAGRTRSRPGSIWKTALMPNARCMHRASCSGRSQAQLRWAVIRRRVCVRPGRSDHVLETPPTPIRGTTRTEREDNACRRERGTNMCQCSQVLALCRAGPAGIGKNSQPLTFSRVHRSCGGKASSSSFVQLSTSEMLSV